MNAEEIIARIEACVALAREKECEAEVKYQTASNFLQRDSAWITAQANCKTHLILQDLLDEIKGENT